MDQRLLESEERLASAQARSQFFWLLADCVLKGPQAESWQMIQGGGTDNVSGSMQEAWNSLVEASGTYDATAWQALAVEHTRLFSGLTECGAPPPPYESVWRNGFDAGSVLAQVTDAYAEAGFADIDLEAGPQDHLGVELKFMAILALREAEAWRLDDTTGAVSRMRQQQSFLDSHLLAWVSRWADALAQHTQERIYWALARLIMIGVTQAVEELNTLR